MNLRTIHGCRIIVARLFGWHLIPKNIASKWAQWLNQKQRAEMPINQAKANFLTRREVV